MSLPIGVKIQAVNNVPLENDIVNGKWWELVYVDGTMQSYTFRNGKKQITTRQSGIDKYIIIPKMPDIEPYFKLKMNC